MTPSDFIRKWEKSELKESAAAQSHFVDLCRLLDVETPTDADAVGDTYCFEKGATKSTGGNGFADVWKKGCFGWEYKGPKANLDLAYAQLQRYAVALENPPLLIVSDTKTIIIRTNWTNSVSEVHTFALTDLVDAKVRETLKNCFVKPEALRPKRTRDDLTKEAADEFSALAQRLRDDGHDAETVAHFVNRLVFCMFAEDVGLLPNKMFERAIEHARKEPEKAQEFLETLFAAMNSGGPVGFETVPWFNGGLFDDEKALPLGRDEIELVYKAAKLNWTDIDPSILGTLFERGLDPSKRSQLGAHYTDRDKIMMIINPVIIEPLESEWAEVRQKISDIIEKAPQQTKEKLLRGAALAARTKALKQAEKLHRAFTKKLEDFRVLDPACGSGNFLYLSLKALKDIEHRANVEAEALGLPRGFPSVGPEAVQGIELNPYAAELARVSVWIGEIQWMLANGFSAKTNPVLDPLDNIECRDAVLNKGGTRANWPAADVVVGNPPFLGSQKMLRELGEEYSNTLRRAWAKVVPATSDLVVYWFARAYLDFELGELQRVGFVSTNSIREQSNRSVMTKIVQNAKIFDAWSDEPWIVDGADVRVSLVCFTRQNTDIEPRLDGAPVSKILSNITSNESNFDLTEASKLVENSGYCVRGLELGGPFELDRLTFERLATLPTNPNGQKNSLVMPKISSADDITGRPSETFIIDFSDVPSKEDAALFEAPFAELESRYENYGTNSKRKIVIREKWWLHRRSGEKVRAAVYGRERFLVTPRVSKHRFFTWLFAPSFPDSRVFAFATSSDQAFGILSSNIHEKWSLATCSWHGVGNDPTYNASIFETFPFPEGMSLNSSDGEQTEGSSSEAIATSAARLNELRENWLNPPDLVKRLPEIVEGYPDRILPVDDKAAEILKKRTLTNLYNERPAWLEHAHRNLDRAVAAAYGWQDDFDAGTLTDEEILKRLFEFNQERAKQEQAEAP